jgi:hypothetical protein
MTRILRVTSQFLISIGFAIGLIVVAGCGGNSPVSGARTGQVSVTIHWPSTRDIPSETRSIRVVAKAMEPIDGPEVGQVVVGRPANASTSQANLTNLPSLRVRLTATAYASTDASGVSIAEGSAEVQVPEDNTVSANITLTSTLDIDVHITPIHGEAPFGGTTQFNAQFNALVAGTADQSVAWEASGGTISGSGLYTAGTTSGVFELEATSLLDSTAVSRSLVSVFSAAGTPPLFKRTYTGTYTDTIGGAIPNSTVTVIFGADDAKGLLYVARGGDPNKSFAEKVQSYPTALSLSASPLPTYPYVINVGLEILERTEDGPWRVRLTLGASINGNNISFVGEDLVPANTAP